MPGAEQVTQVVASLEAELNRLKHELTTMGVADSIPAASETCTVADYILERLNQLGVTVRPPLSPSRPPLTSAPSRPCSVSPVTSTLVSDLRDRRR